MLIRICDSLLNQWWPAGGKLWRCHGETNRLERRTLASSNEDINERKASLMYSSIRRIAVALLSVLIALVTTPSWASTILYKYMSVDGISIFYREAGDKTKPTILLLHGFPSSSHEFRELIPQLADQFHVIAPDYPGMGYSEAPTAEKFAPTFDGLANVTEQLLEELGESHMIVYMTDFGGPVGMRIAVKHPNWIAGMIFQNAVISLAGLDPARLKRDEAISGAANAQKRALAESHVSMETALLLYQHGARNPAGLNPDAWTNDAAALANPASKRIMTDLQFDIPSNIASFPVWQEYLRVHQPKTLVVWGKNDPIFSPDGAEAIKKEIPSAEIHYYDTGHFALEEEHDDIARQIKRFFGHG